MDLGDVQLLSKPNVRDLIQFASTRSLETIVDDKHGVDAVGDLPRADSDE